jgi:hypothetical protein
MPRSHSQLFIKHLTRVIELGPSRVTVPIHGHPAQHYKRKAVIDTTDSELATPNFRTVLVIFEDNTSARVTIHAGDVVPKQYRLKPGQMRLAK